MPRTLNEELQSLPKARRTRIEKRAAELIEQELSLRELRKALNRTQAELAARMKVGQDAVCRYEQRTDMMLSTLRRYVEAMGGTLSLVAQFPNRKAVRISTLSDLSGPNQGRSDAAPSRTRGSSAGR